MVAKKKGKKNERWWKKNVRKYRYLNFENLGGKKKESPCTTSDVAGSRRRDGMVARATGVLRKDTGRGRSGNGAGFFWEGLFILAQK